MLNRKLLSCILSIFLIFSALVVFFIPENTGINIQNKTEDVVEQQVAGVESFKQSILDSFMLRACMTVIDGEDYCESDTDCNEFVIKYKEHGQWLNLGAILQNRCSIFNEIQGFDFAFCNAIMNSKCDDLPAYQKPYCLAALKKDISYCEDDDCKSIGNKLIMYYEGDPCLIDDGIISYSACRAMLYLDCEKGALEGASILQLTADGQCNEIEHKGWREVCNSPDPHSRFYPSHSS